jgi:hypothetical protein
LFRMNKNLDKYAKDGFRYGGSVKPTAISAGAVDTDKLGKKVNRYEAGQKKTLDTAMFGFTYDTVMANATQGEVDPTLQALEAAHRQYYPWDAVVFAVFASLATGLMAAAITIGYLADILPVFDGIEGPLNIGIILLTFGLMSLYAVHGSKDHTKRCTSTKWKAGDAPVKKKEAKIGELKTDKIFHGRICETNDDCSFYKNAPSGLCKAPGAATGYPIHLYRSGFVPAALIGGIITVVVALRTFDYRPSQLDLVQLTFYGVGAAYVGASIFSWTTL